MQEAGDKVPTCKGLAPTDGMFNSPGKWEDDVPNDTCAIYADPNDCMAKCIKEIWNSPPPKYGVVPLGSLSNCQTTNTNILERCALKCSDGRKKHILDKN